MENRFTLTMSDDNEITVNGTDAEIKKALRVLGEFILNDEALRAANINALVEMAHFFRNRGEASPEDLETAKKFFAAAEEFGDPEASDYLSTLQDNPLIAEAMWLRAAERNAPSPVYSLQEDYAEQTVYWRKKIAVAEGKPFAEDAPADDEILKSDRLKFFTVYKRAFAGDLDAMKTCLEFCAEEAAYWNKREP